MSRGSPSASPPPRPRRLGYILKTMPHCLPLRFILGIVIVALCVVARAKDVEEKYDDGSPHLRYRVDDKDRKIGDYQEFFQNGKVKVHGSYAADKKSGAWNAFNEEGKPLEVAHYRNGVLEGPYQWNYPSGHVQFKASFHADDFSGPITTFDEKGHTLLRLSYPRPLEAVIKAWKQYAPAERADPKFLEEPIIQNPYQPGKIAPESLSAAARYVMLYRALSGVPTPTLSIDANLCDLAQHGSVVLAKLGHLTHTPEKPSDMDDAFFKLAYAGCNQSNLYQGRTNLFDAIDGFMDDSDASNIQKIGHRQWVLAPGLARTGFGSAQGFSAMHVLQAAQGSPANYNFIAYPGEGYYPKQLLHEHAAWSIHLNSSKAKIDPIDQVKIAVTPLDEHFSAGDEASCKIVSVLPNSTSNWNVIVFQPSLTSLSPGRYFVQVTGVRTMTGAPAPFSYLVDLKEMPVAEDKAQS